MAFSAFLTGFSCKVCVFEAGPEYYIRASATFEAQVMNLASSNLELKEIPAGSER